MASSETDSLNFTFQMRPSFAPETPSYRPSIPPVTAGAHKLTVSFSANQPPLGEYIGPVGKGAQFQHIRQAQAMGQSPRSSSPSSMSSMRTPEVSELLGDRETGKGRDMNRHIILIEESSFTLEELRDSDTSGNSDMEVVRPDYYEEADSDWEKGDGDSSAKFQHTSWQEELERHTGIVRDFQGLCSGVDGFSHSLSHADQDRKHRRGKNNRWNASMFKRSFSQTIASDTDGDDEADMNCNNVGSSARRQRRRVGSREPKTRSPLAFEDTPTGLDAEEDGELDKDDSPEPADSAEYIMGTLPFWVMTDMMQVDSDTDH